MNDRKERLNQVISTPRTSSDSLNRSRWSLLWPWFLPVCVPVLERAHIAISAESHLFFVWSVWLHGQHVSEVLHVRSTTPTHFACMSARFPVLNRRFGRRSVHRSTCSEVPRSEQLQHCSNQVTSSGVSDLDDWQGHVKACCNLGLFLFAPWGSSAPTLRFRWNRSRSHVSPAFTTLHHPQ